MHKPPFTIFVPERLCVAGGVVHGFIELDFRLLQEEDIDEVHLKLRGHAETSITSNNQTVRENIDLVRFKVSIWTRGSAYPLPGSHALVIPFDIPIRPGIPPSFVHIRVEERVVIHYYIGVVGVRPGALRSNRRLNLPIIVVPPDPSGARVRLSLESGWTGPWATETGRKRLRKGIWGAKAKVECEVGLNDSLSRNRVPIRDCNPPAYPSATACNSDKCKDPILYLNCRAQQGSSIRRQGEALANSLA